MKSLLISEFSEISLRRRNAAIISEQRREPIAATETIRRRKTSIFILGVAQLRIKPPVTCGLYLTVWQHIGNGRILYDQEGCMSECGIFVT